MYNGIFKCDPKFHASIIHIKLGANIDISTLITSLSKG